MKFVYFLLVLSFTLIFYAQGEMVIGDRPYAVIKGVESMLNRPESVTFSPSGDCIAVSNFWGTSIVLYKRIENERGIFESTPSCIIEDDQNLNGPHHAVFIKDNNHLAVVSRWNSALVFYEKEKSSDLQYDYEPKYIFKGSASKISHPTSVDISPSGHILAVSNRSGGITLYNRKGRSGKFNKSPFQEITMDHLNQYGITPSHGLCFSPDGNAFASVHKHYPLNPKSHGEAALVIFEKKSKNSKGFNPCPSFIFYAGNKDLHSVSFHPSGNYLALTVEKSEVIIFHKKEGSKAFEPILTIPVIPESGLEGPKGVSFSPDGKTLAFSVMSPPSIVFYDFGEID